MGDDYEINEELLLKELTEVEVEEYSRSLSEVTTPVETVKEIIGG